MPKQEDQQDTIQSTLHQQLLKSHLRVAGLAAIAFFLVAIAIQVLHRPITTIRSVNVPTANAAMSIQLGLQRSEASLRGFVTLKEPTLRKKLGFSMGQRNYPSVRITAVSNKATRLRRSQASDVRAGYKIKTIENPSIIDRFDCNSA